MANENENIFQELTAQEQATIAGASGLDFGIVGSLLGNAIKTEEEKQDVDMDITSFLNSFNFGGNSVE